MAKTKRKPKPDWVEMPVADLAPNPKNPRQITDQNLGHLQGSVSRFGLVENLVWNARTKRLVSGHQRVKVLQQLGQETAMVRVVNLDKDEELALMVVLNSPEAQGEFTDDLVDVLGEIEGLDGLDALGLESLLVDDPEPPNLSLDEHLTYSVIADFETESEQAALLEELEKRGIRCRLLIA